LSAALEKGRNTDSLVSKALEGLASAGLETKKIYLNDLAIKPCQACSEDPEPDFCIIHDGMDTLYEAFNKADVLIIGSPAYYETISAQLRLVVDRCNCLTEMVRDKQGRVAFRSKMQKRKRALFIWVADFARTPEHALASIRLWCKDANIEIVDKMIITGSERDGGVKQQPNLLETAFQKGAAIASEANEKRTLKPF
jgi:multimeric flavodoxin WrbA